MGPGSSLDVALLHHRNRQSLSSYVPLAADGSVIELPRGRRANNNIDDAHADRQTDTVYAIWNQRLMADWKLKLSASIGNRDGTYKGGFWGSYDATAQTISWLGFEGITDARTGYLDAQFTGHVGAHRIVAGVSHEQTRTKPIENWTEAAFTFYEQLVDMTTGPKLGLTWNLAPTTSLYASYGEG